MAEWARLLRGHPWRGQRGFGTGSIDLDEALAMDGAMTGEVDAYPEDLILLSAQHPDAVKKTDDPLYLAAAASSGISLSLRTYKLAKGWLRETRWLMSAMLMMEDSDDVFRFGYVAGSRQSQLFECLDQCRQRRGAFHQSPELALRESR